MNPKLVTKRDDSDMCFRYFEFCEKLEANCFSLDYLGFFLFQDYCCSVETEGKTVIINTLYVLTLKVYFFKLAKLPSIQFGRACSRYIILITI